MENTQKLAYTFDEFAAAIGLGRSKARELMNTEGFPAVRVGRRILIPVGLLNEWFAKQPTVANGLPYSAVS